MSGIFLANRSHFAVCLLFYYYAAKFSLPFNTFTHIRTSFLFHCNFFFYRYLGCDQEYDVDVEVTPAMMDEE